MSSCISEAAVDLSFRHCCLQDRRCYETCACSLPDRLHLAWGRIPENKVPPHKCQRNNCMSIERNVVSTQAKKLENCAHIGGKTNGELSTVACTSTNFKTTQPRRVSTTYNRAENNRSNIYSFLGPHRIEFWLCLLSSRPNSFSLSLFGLSILIWLWT